MHILFAKTLSFSCEMNSRWFEAYVNIMKLHLPASLWIKTFLSSVQETMELHLCLRQDQVWFWDETETFKRWSISSTTTLAICNYFLPLSLCCPQWGWPELQWEPKQLLQPVLAQLLYFRWVHNLLWCQHKSQFSRPRCPSSTDSPPKKKLMRATSSLSPSLIIMGLWIERAAPKGPQWRAKRWQNRFVSSRRGSPLCSRLEMN